MQCFDTIRWKGFFSCMHVKDLSVFVMLIEMTFFNYIFSHIEDI